MTDRIRLQKSLRTFALPVALGALAASCGSGGDDRDGPVTGTPGDGGVGSVTRGLDEIDLDLDPDGDRIVDLPAGTDAVITDVFTRYAAVELPEGRIHLLAQSAVGNERIRRSREILAQHLRDVAGTSEGADKGDVAADMASVGATLALFDDEASASPSNTDVASFLDAADGTVVSLASTFVVLEGTPEYMAAMPAEDRTFGAAAELVLRTGLETARGSFADELDAIRLAMIADGTYGESSTVGDEGRNAAFLALAIDVHSGVWGHDPFTDGTAGDESTLAFASRVDLRAGAPALADWIESFFSTDHDFDVVLPESFTGNFDCLRRTSNPYTARSQHLRRIRMSGTNSGEIFGAPFDSVLTGNSGNNNLKGRAGDDVLEGGVGFDTAVFSGPRANYVITFDGPTVIVEDVHGGHDGSDRLTGFERLEFTDGGENL